MKIKNALVLLVCFCVAMTVPSAACGKNKNDSTISTVSSADSVANSSDSGSGDSSGEKDEYKFTERNIKTDGQTYVGGLIPYPDELWNTPEYDYCTDLDFGGVGDVKGIFYTSPIKYNGKKTRIAAYVGFPANIPEGTKVPAIVLVHGGLGTAIPDWVKYWNDLGFAAISMDTEGAEPSAGVSNSNNVHIQENRYKGDAVYSNGPTNVGFADYKNEMENQWMYHATSAVILACSLISSFNVVDSQKIGITGISWGGMITNIVVGYDDRFSFAVPVYGALSLTESCSSFATIYSNGENNDISSKRWDTLEPLKQTNCKVFNINAIKDFAFSFDASSRCSQAAKGFVLFKTTFPHGQSEGANETDIPFFAKYLCGAVSKYVEILNNPSKTDNVLTFRTYGKVMINSIKIMYTSSAKPDKDAVWKESAVKFIEGVYSYTPDVPTEATYYYVSICYNNKLEVSSYYFQYEYAEF